MTKATMTATYAQTHFGEFIDKMQRTPIVLTRNKRPVGICLTPQDLEDFID